MGPSAAPANLVKGGAFLVFAVLMFDAIGAIVKYLSANYPPQQLSLFRNLFGLLPSTAVLFATSAWRAAALARSCNSVLRRAWPSRFRHPHHLGLRGTIDHYRPVGAGAESTYRAWRWSAVAVGFAGVVPMMQPGGDVFSLHALLPLGATFG